MLLAGDLSIISLTCGFYFFCFLGRPSISGLLFFLQVRVSRDIELFQLSVRLSEASVSVSCRTFNTLVPNQAAQACFLYSSRPQQSPKNACCLPGDGNMVGWRLDAD